MNSVGNRLDFGTSTDQILVNYACAKDDERFIQTYHHIWNLPVRRIRWVFEALAYAVGHSNLNEGLFFRMLEESEETVWLWVDGDEAALPDFKSEYQYGCSTGPEPISYYKLAFEALQKRHAHFESLQMAKRRQIVHSVTPLVRLAAIVWLIFTSEAVRDLQRSEWKNKGEWRLVDVIKDWWRTLWTAHYALPLAASISEFEITLHENGNRSFRGDNMRRGLAAWFHVQSVLYPENLILNSWSLNYGNNFEVTSIAPVNLIPPSIVARCRSCGEYAAANPTLNTPWPPSLDILLCEACYNHEIIWVQDWILELKTTVLDRPYSTDRQIILVFLAAEFRRNGDVRSLVTNCAPYLDYTPLLMRTLNTIISKRDPKNSLIVVSANTPQLEDYSPQSEPGLLVVIIKAHGGEILALTIEKIERADIQPITGTESLRNVLKSTNCDHVMQQFSIPWVMAVMELLLFEIKLRVPNHKLCSRYLRRLSRTHGVLPLSFLIYNVEQDGNFAVKTGGYADVYRGRLNQGVVCLKVLRYFSSCTQAARDKLVKDFCREALVWKQLDHPNILPFIGVSANLFRPSLCLISPWMHNGNINEFLEKNPGHERLNMIAEIVHAIDYIHSYDPPIVHADIRGANILITHDLRCCLADFGLAAVTESQPFTGTTRRSQGTLRWMAPEYFQDNAPQIPQPPRDVYAFGCTVLEIFTGKPPFHYLKHDGAVLNQVLSGTRPRRDDLPSGHNGYLDELWSLLESCWHQDPACRPTATDISTYLNNLAITV